MSSAAWPSAQLKNLERIGALVPEPTSPSEIQRLLDLAEGSLSAARTTSLAIEPRFQLAYSAAHHLALAALRANDYRTATREGHRMLVFQTLPNTVGLDVGISRTLDRAHRKRNELEYTGAVDVPASEAEDLIAAVAKLRQSVRDWLSANRPALIEASK
jgi:uncharacterized protein (UPF0332 family)